jgi:D-serine deaminase-like pyridoxal phosphate-dependent protein
MNIHTATTEQLEAAISLNRKWMQDHASEEGAQRFQKTLKFSQLMSDQLLSLRLTA